MKRLAIPFFLLMMLCVIDATAQYNPDRSFNANLPKFSICPGVGIQASSILSGGFHVDALLIGAPNYVVGFPSSATFNNYSAFSKKWGGVFTIGLNYHSYYDMNSLVTKTAVYEVPNTPPANYYADWRISATLILQLDEGECLCDFSNAKENRTYFDVP